MNKLQGTELAVEAIGVSLWHSMRRLMGADLASLRFAQVFIEVRHELGGTTSSANDPALLSRISDLQAQLNEEAIHDLLRDRRRYALLAAIGILDSFLSDVVRLYILHNPAAISSAISPNSAAKLARCGLTPEQEAEEIVRRHLKSWSSRLDFLCAQFGLSVSKKDRSELARLIELRNEVAHHVGLYRFNKELTTGSVYATPRPTPEVSSRDSLGARMLVAEITDAVLAAMAKRCFNFTPSTRPLTPEVIAAHAELRSQWSRQDDLPDEIEEVAEPEWRVRSANDSDLVWVGERTRNIMVVPTGIANVPALISVRRNDRHGTNAYITVDGGTRRLLDGGDSAQILDEIVSGKQLLLEFHEEPAEGTKFARYSLEGFADAWRSASGARVSVKSPG